MTAGIPYTMPLMRPDRDTDLWRLEEDWSIDFVLPDGRSGRVSIEAGFVTDGASVPRMAWFAAGHPMESPRVVAALAHDWLYASHATDRETADAIYAAILRNVGRAGWRVAVEHWTLRRFGWVAYGIFDTDEMRVMRNHGRIEWKEVKA